MPKPLVTLRVNGIYQSFLTKTHTRNANTLLQISMIGSDVLKVLGDSNSGETTLCHLNVCLTCNRRLGEGQRSTRASFQFHCSFMFYIVFTVFLKLIVVMQQVKYGHLMGHLLLLGCGDAKCSVLYLSSALSQLCSQFEVYLEKSYNLNWEVSIVMYLNSLLGKYSVI